MKHKDKFMHLIVCAAIVIVVAHLPYSRPLYGAIAAMIWGFGKECYDKIKGGKFDWMDIAADLCGVALGVVIC